MQLIKYLKIPIKDKLKKIKFIIYNTYSNIIIVLIFTKYVINNNINNI